MRPNGQNNNRRPRGRHHGGNGQGGSNGGGGNGGGSNPMGGNRPRSASSLRHQTFDSNGPDMRVRGNAWQVYEKYQTLARDAMGAGDRVAAENYQQHAEHYYRIIEAINEATAAEQRVRGPSSQPYGQQPETPASYYTAEGTLMPGGAPNQPPQVQPDGNIQPMAMPPAEVQLRNPPQQQPSPFFAADEVEEMNEPEPLVARR